MRWLFLLPLLAWLGCSQAGAAEKDQPIIGMVIIKDLVEDGDAWQHGEILDPANGKTYTCKIWLEQGLLKVRSYLGIFFRTQTWQPVKN